MPHTHAQLLFHHYHNAQLIPPNIIHANYVSSSTIGALQLESVSPLIIRDVRELFLSISIAH